MLVLEKAHSQPPPSRRPRSLAVGDRRPGAGGLTRGGGGSQCEDGGGGRHWRGPRTCVCPWTCVSPHTMPAPRGAQAP